MMKKQQKNIGYVVNEYPVASETFITTEMRALQQLGMCIKPFTFKIAQGPTHPGDEEFVEQLKNPVQVSHVRVLKLFPKLLFLLPFSGWKGVLFALRQKGIRSRSLLLQGIKLACLLDDAECGHVHAHFAWVATSSAIVAARLLGIGVSFTGHGSDIYKTPCDLPLKLQNADFVVAVCKRMQNDMRKLAPTANVKVVPCGVDTDYFQPMKKRHSDRHHFLYLGRISETKGVDHLIRAMTHIPPERRPHIDIAGDGPLLDKFQTLSARLGVQHWLHFIGPVTRDWVRDNAAAYKAMVLPFCRSDNGQMDTGPLVLKEAMALKVPIITTDIMTQSEFLDDNCASIVPSANPEALAACIQAVMAGRGEFNELRIAGRVERAYIKVQQQLSAMTQARSLKKLILKSGVHYEG